MAAGIPDASPRTGAGAFCTSALSSACAQGGAPSVSPRQKWCQALVLRPAPAPPAGSRLISPAGPQLPHLLNGYMDRGTGGSGGAGREGVGDLQGRERAPHGPSRKPPPHQSAVAPGARAARPLPGPRGPPPRGSCLQCTREPRLSLRSRERSCLFEMHQETPAWGTPLLPCAGSCRPAGTGDKSPRGRKHQGQQYGRQTGLVVLAGGAGGSVATECPPVPSPASPGSSAEFCAIQLPAR